MAYSERLHVPWWVWPLALAAAALLAAEVSLGSPELRTPLLYLGLPALAGVGLLYLGRIPVGVIDGELRVDDARLPVEYVAEVTELTPADKRELMGPSADPLAFIVQRPWVRGSVRIDLDDPADPTPYWIVSTRRPAALAAAIEAARRRVSST